MHEVIKEQYKQIPHSFEVNKDVKVEGEFDSIILVGMGGSGHPGDLVNALGLAKVPLYVHRNYGLPLNYLKQMGLEKPLILASSYSGNTEETLEAYAEAKEKGLPLLVSSAGGKLQELALADGNPFAKIDFTGMQPRHTLLAAASGIVKALINSGLARDVEAEWLAAAEFVKEKTAELEAPALELAKRVKDKVPVYNSGDSLGFAAKNFKIQTNENAKYPGFWNTFPELNHNELVGFSKLKESQNPNNFIVVMLRDENDHPRVKARMDVTKSLYEEWGVDVWEFTAPGNNLTEKIFSTATLGFIMTFALAESYGIDPIPVHGVEDFKAKLKEVAGG